MNYPNGDLALADKRYYVVKAAITSWIGPKRLVPAPVVEGHYDLLSGPLPMAEAETLREDLYRSLDRQTVKLSITGDIDRYGLADHELAAKPDPTTGIIETELEKP